MANVNVKFNNKEFLLSCEDGQEEHLEELSFHLNEKFNNSKAIFLIFIGMTVFAIQDTLIKLVSDQINLYLIYLNLYCFH